MKAYLLAAAVALAATPILGQGITLASSDDDRLQMQPGETALTRAEVRKKLEDKGYKVLRVKRDDGVYEAYVTNAKGVLYEVKVHPVSGEILKLELED